jgi:hypothetical protein
MLINKYDPREVNKLLELLIKIQEEERPYFKCSTDCSDCPKFLDCIRGAILDTFDYKEPKEEEVNEESWRDHPSLSASARNGRVC